MTDRTDRLIVESSYVDGLGPGLAKNETAAKGVGTAAQAAGKEAASGLALAEGGSAKLEAAIKKASAALSPRGIVDGAARIRIALEDIEKEATRAGQAIGPGLAAQMQRAEAAIATAIPRAGRLADTIADTRKQAGLAAEGYKALGAAGGGLQGVFTSMDDAGSGWVSTLGKVGIASFGLVQAFQLVSSIAKTGSEAVQKLVTAHYDLAVKQELLRAATDRATIATSAAMKGQIAFGGSFAQTIRNLELQRVAMGGATLSMEAIAKAAGVTVPQSFETFKTHLASMSALSSNAFAKGAQEARLWGLENLGALKAAEEQARITGEVLPAALRRMIEETERAIDADKRFKAEIDELNKAHTFSLELAQKLEVSLTDEVRSREAAAAAAQHEIDAATKKIAADRAEIADIEEMSSLKLRALNEELLAERVTLEQYSKAKTKIVMEAAEAEEAANQRIIASEKQVEAARAKEQEEAYKAAEAQYKLNKANDEGMAKTDSATVSLTEMVAAMNGETEAAGQAAESVARSTEAHNAHADTVKRLRSEQIELTDAWMDANGKIHDMSEKVGPLGRLMETLGTSMVNAQESTTKYGQSVSSAKDATLKFAEALE